MLITIKNVKHEWKSPDERVNIWSLNDQDGNSWQTRSQKIASSEGQTMELTTTISKGGKTYLIQPPREDGAYGPQPAAPSAPKTPSAPAPASGSMVSLEAAVARFEVSIDAFERAVDRLLKRLTESKPSYIAPSGDTVVRDIPESDPLGGLQGSDAFDKALGIFGGGEEVKDDIR